MSESDDIIDSDLWWDGLKLFLKSWLQLLFLRSVLVLLFLRTWWWWCRLKFGWLSCWLFKIWSFRSFSFSLLSIRLSFIETGDDDVVVAVESEAVDAVDNFLLDFFSFWWRNEKTVLWINGIISVRNRLQFHRAFWVKMKLARILHEFLSLFRKRVSVN